MGTVELKKHLIDRIAAIEDITFLEAIKTILDTQCRSQSLQLNEEQRYEITASKKEIESGRFTTQSEIDEKFGQWLNTK